MHQSGDVAHDYFFSLWKKLHFVSLVMLHTMPGFYHVNGLFIFEIV